MQLHFFNYIGILLFLYILNNNVCCISIACIFLYYRCVLYFCCTNISFFSIFSSFAIKAEIPQNICYTCNMSLKDLEF